MPRGALSKRIVPLLRTEDFEIISSVGNYPLRVNLYLEAKRKLLS